MSSTPVPPIEVGSLTASSPDESQFIGSSSGVFFISTVHRAFAKSRKGGIPNQNDGADLSSRDAASVDNFIVGNESPRRSQSTDQTDRALNQNTQGSQAVRRHDHVLGIHPSLESATELLMVYFQTWHPLLPFLHGPTFLQDVEAFYSYTPNVRDQLDRQQICRTILSQCVFNLAALDRPELGLPEASRIESSSGLLSLIGIVAAKHDITGLQALLAMQLYLIATMSLRAASTVGGVLVKLLFHGGFHRCPFRYTQISRHDCEIRKRILWSAYATDRYLSQALGHPLGMQDSDIDVCIPGTEELHQPVHQSHSSIGDDGAEARAHLPQGHPDSVQTPSDSSEHGRSTNRGFRTKQVQSGEDVLANYVSYCRITGRALELFHKSLHTRSVDHRHITLLTSEVYSWWNNLPRHLQEHTSSDSSASFSAFFNILYQNLIILINRPFLSLSTSTPEFRLSLQTCAGASRKTILILRDHATAFSWPGILSGAWMAGLVLAFGCELELYPFAKGVTEVEICLSLLQKMSDRFSTARHCHAVLGILLNDLHAQFDDREGSRPANRDGNVQKRRRLNTSSSTMPNQLRFPSDVETQHGEVSSQDPTTAPNNSQPLTATSTQIRFSPPIIEYQQPGQVMPWPDPMMSGNSGDVFGQVSWEALFQGDGSGWEDWDAIGNV